MPGRPATCRAFSGTATQCLVPVYKEANDNEKVQGGCATSGRPGCSLLVLLLLALVAAGSRPRPPSAPPGRF